MKQKQNIKQQLKTYTPKKLFFEGEESAQGPGIGSGADSSGHRKATKGPKSGEVNGSEARVPKAVKRPKIASKWPV